MTICTRCEIDKEDGEFHPHPTKKNGLHSWCKLCQKQYQHEHRTGAGRNSTAFKALAKRRAHDQHVTMAEVFRRKLIKQYGIELVEVMEEEKDPLLFNELNYS